MEIQSIPCRSSNSDWSIESLQDETRYHSAAGRMDTYCPPLERVHNEIYKKIKTIKNYVTKILLIARYGYLKM